MYIYIYVCVYTHTYNKDLLKKLTLFKHIGLFSPILL